MKSICQNYSDVEYSRRRNLIAPFFLKTNGEYRECKDNKIQERKQNRGTRTLHRQT